MALLAQFNIQTTCFLQELHWQLPGENKTKQKTNPPWKPHRFPGFGVFLLLVLRAVNSHYFSTQKAANTRNLTRSSLAEASCSRRVAGHFWKQKPALVNATATLNQLWGSIWWLWTSLLFFVRDFIRWIQELLKPAHLYLEHWCF